MHDVCLDEYQDMAGIFVVEVKTLTGSAVIAHDVTTGTGYCLVGFNWIIDFLN